MQRPDGQRSVQAAERPDRLPSRAEREQEHVLEQEADGERGNEHRRRRRAPERPEDALLDERECGDDGEAREDGDDRGPAAQIRERVATCGDQLAVGEVDEPHHAEHEPDPERDDAVDGAERDRVDHRLEEAHDR